MQMFNQAVEVTSTQTVYEWNNIPMIVGLIFALAGSFFVAIYFLRRRKK